MNVSHDQIIQKMINELEKAKNTAETKQAIQQHAVKVRVLADLLVENTEEGPVKTSIKQPDEQPGDIQRPNSLSGQGQTVNTEPPESIFDF